MRYQGPTEASKYPRRTPWLFRGNNDLIALGVVVFGALLWVWS